MPAGLSVLLVVCALFAGCVKEELPDVAMLESLCQSQKWDEARTAAKRILLQDPQNAAAHFYYAKCIFNSPRFYPAVVEGELHYALALAQEGGTGSMDPAQFKMQCNLDLAAYYLRIIGNSLSQRPSIEHLAPLLDKLEKAVDDAKAVAPENPEVKKLTRLLENVRRPRLRP